MNDQPNSDLHSPAQSSEASPAQEQEEQEGMSRVSDEEGFKSAEKVFKIESDTDDSPDEDRGFLKYLSYRKRARDLGLDAPSTVINQSGIHIKDSYLNNYGNIVGNDQAISSSHSAQDAAEREAQSSSHEEIEFVFDECKDISQRSFMVALAVLNGCNYRVVLEASQKLQTILQPPPVQPPLDA
jgi:hypothetical protein